MHLLRPQTIPGLIKPIVGFALLFFAVQAFSLMAVDRELASISVCDTSQTLSHDQNGKGLQHCAGEIEFCPANCTLSHTGQSLDSASPYLQSPVYNGVYRSYVGRLPPGPEPFPPKRPLSV